jgi:hypothetical protein
MRASSRSNKVITFCSPPDSSRSARRASPSAAFRLGPRRNNDELRVAVQGECHLAVRAAGWREFDSCTMLAREISQSANGLIPDHMMPPT